MNLSKNQWFEAVGGVFGAAIAFLYYALASWAVGRAGILALVVGVPVGVVLGSLLVKLLVFAHRLISESESS